MFVPPIFVHFDLFAEFSASGFIINPLFSLCNYLLSKNNGKM